MDSFAPQLKKEIYISEVLDYFFKNANTIAKMETEIKNLYTSDNKTLEELKDSLNAIKTIESEYNNIKQNTIHKFDSLYNAYTILMGVRR